MKTSPAGTTPEEKEEAKLKNEAFKLDYVNQEHDACLRVETLESNLCVA